MTSGSPSINLSTVIIHSHKKKQYKWLFKCSSALITHIFEEHNGISMTEFADETTLLLDIIFGKSTEYIFGSLQSTEPGSYQLRLRVVRL